VKLPKSGVTIVVLLRARAGHEPFLEAELRALVPPTRKEEGCLQYDLHRAADGTGAFLLHEVWESRRTPYRSHQDGSFFAVECAEGCAAGVARCDVLDAGCVTGRVPHALPHFCVSVDSKGG